MGEAFPVGARLAAIRTARGLSMSRLAVLAGLDAPLVSRVEAGRQGIRMGTLLRLLGALRVGVADFFDPALTAPPDAGGAEVGDPRVGGRVLYLRLERGWTPRELARRAGCAAITVARLERGEVEPNVEAVGRIAGALGLSPAAFFRAPAPPGRAGRRPVVRPGRSAEGARAGWLANLARRTRAGNMAHRHELRQRIRKGRARLADPTTRPPEAAAIRLRLELLLAEERTWSPRCGPMGRWGTAGGRRTEAGWAAAWWRKRAEHVAAELEALAKWIRVQTMTREAAPAEPCRSCGAVLWWERPAWVGGGRVCGVCHPDPRTLAPPGGQAAG